MDTLQEQINEKQGKILEHKSFLISTDYKVTRAVETNTEIDEETRALRADARAAINRLDGEIADLYLQLESRRSEEIPTPII